MMIMSIADTTHPTIARPGTVHLVGGGCDESAVVALVQRFVAEASDLQHDDLPRAAEWRI